MKKIDRRRFLDTARHTGLGLATGLTILPDARSVRAAPANEKLILASVGCHGRGYMLAQGFASRPDCHIAYVCDVDSGLFASRAKGLAALQGGPPPRCLQDFRLMLDDKSVDAVVIATPPHWHALATIWCCQAGKDVYCEKPQSQNCWEGRKAVEAARKYRRIVQIGVQNRSALYNFAAKKYLEEGKLGAVHLVRIFNQKGEPDGPLAADSDPPAGFDWEMWNGPALEHRYNQTLREGWRYFWRYSGGDMTYDGVHQIDLARWVCNLGLPKTVYTHGARYERDGAAETPDTQISVLEFPEVTMTFEMTLFTPYMIKSDQGVRDGDIYPYWPQNTERIEIYGTEAVMYLGRMGAGWQVFVRQKNRQPVLADQLHGKFPDPEHKENFVRAVRRQEPPHAEIEEIHRSTLLVHYAMLSHRVGGQKLAIDPQTEQIVGNPEAMKLFRREGRKPWVVPETV